MKEFENILKGMDPKDMEKNLKNANVFAKTEEGKKLIETFKNNKPDDIASLMKIIKNNPDILKSIEQFFNK